MLQPLRKNTCIVFLLLLLFASANAHGSNDSLFISDLKKFAFSETGYELKGDFYITYAKQDNPYIWLVAARPGKIGRFNDSTSRLAYAGYDEDVAKSRENEMKEKGYQTFPYKTYGNAAAQLSTGLLSYPGEAQSFIVFHELTHNTLAELHIRMPYEFNEALSDVIGNYGTLDYAEAEGKVDAKAAKNQVRVNEKLYKHFNTYIEKINKHPEKGKSYHESCGKKVHHLLKKANAFQKDRFNYTVNNAYLLKNRNYCMEYFLLKRVLIKQKTIQKLLEVMKTLPDGVEECEKYLEKFT